MAYDTESIIQSLENSPRIVPYHPDKAEGEDGLLKCDLEESLARYTRDRQFLVQRLGSLNSSVVDQFEISRHPKKLSSRPEAKPERRDLLFSRTSKPKADPSTRPRASVGMTTDAVICNLSLR